MLDILSLRAVSVLIRPPTLLAGKPYFLRVRQANGACPVYVPVWFFDYDPCPALVLIRGNDNHIWRAPRDDLFAPESAIRD